MKLHDGPVGAVDMHGGFDGRVHRDPVDLAHSGHQQNVGKGGGVEPHVSKMCQCTNFRGGLGAPVRVHTQ